MSFTTQEGRDLGHIQINLRSLGVHPDDYDSVMASVIQLGDLTYLPEERKSFTSKSKPNRIKVRINDGFLHAQVDVGQLGKAKRDALIEERHDTIVSIARHKAEMPGADANRRKQRSKSYVNDPRRATAVT